MARFTRLSAEDDTVLPDRRVRPPRAQLTPKAAPDELASAAPQPASPMRKEPAIMSTSHRSTTRFPGTRPPGRRQGAKRRGGAHRSAR
jgi:hypothetical protein